MHSRLLQVICFSCLAGTGRLEAEIRPEYSLRDLALSEGVLVSVRPVEDASPTKGPAATLGNTFVVDEVFNGDPALADKTLKVRGNEDFLLRDRFLLEDQPESNMAKKIPKLSRLLLLLAPDNEGNLRMQYAYGETEEGGCVRTTSSMGQGRYVVSRPVDMHWDEAINRVRRFRVEVEAARALRKIENPVERNQRIFEWIRQHEYELPIPNPRARCRIPMSRITGGV